MNGITNEKLKNAKISVIGGGLAGCEAALWLAGKGVQVTLYEQKPTHFSPAHKSAGFAELICSNSLKAERLDSASGLLKEEMRRMGSQLLEAAEEAARKAALQAELRKIQREEKEYDTLRQNVDALLERPKEQEQQRQRSNDLE